MALVVVTLAAGKGSRMNSELPKVLHTLAGQPMLSHVLQSAGQLPNARQVVVVGHGAEVVQQTFADAEVDFVIQHEQKGTGHAVAQAMPLVDTADTVLILYGDVPLIKTATLAALLEASQSGLALLTVDLVDPNGYGRIVRDANGVIQEIIEHKDASAEQHQINEVNTGILAVAASHLQQWLPQLSANNAQGEYYLTDVIAMSVADGIPVNSINATDEFEVQGVNDRIQLAQLERHFQAEQAHQLLAAGVSLADPSRIDIRGQVTVGRDVSIDVNCVFEGDVELADGVTIGPNCVIRQSKIGANSHVESFSHIDQTYIDANCMIGPYARLRPGAELAENAKVGNFCEVKKSQIGAGAKVNHLSYIGDASVGKNANIGAGTITCNYDGVNKFKTNIGNDAFIGSNTALVAPVTIGDTATVAAGSVITKDVEAQDLAFGRSKQRNISGWQRPTKNND